MKILLLSPQPFFEVRGTPINVRLMAVSLAELGHQVDILAYPFGEEVSIPNVEVHRVFKIPGLPKAPIGPSLVKIINDALMAPKAAWMLAFGGYDVVHGVEEAGIMAWALAKIFRVPYIFDMDSHMTDQLRYSGFLGNRLILAVAEKLESAAIAKAASVITVCPYLTDIARKYTTPDKVHQVEDIPQSFPHPPEELTPVSLRAELDIPHDAPVILYTGNLEKYQGVDLMLEAAAEVVKSNPDARFVIAGGDAGKVERYRAMARRLGVDQSVVFAGARPLSHMPVFHEMADILLSPRLGGTNTPLKIYTYLATGKPVVATDLPTHTQLLTKEVAVLARPEKVEYAAALVLLLEDKTLREKIGHSGRRFVEENYNPASFRRKMESAYEAVEVTNG
ncbi:MAG: glycosyltransferase family 4 protein [Nitrospinota bacterium]|nr:glycosyltransferase family 4 protein [Nitrospinota bacterium]MDH5757427.1 glycosyltransferase family 4 protein [Nitrospinota bacterium]